MTKKREKTDERISPSPDHVAIIMDGNGRWAESRGLSRIEGHRAATDNIRRVVRCFADYGVKYLTIYAFSTENWSRPEKEVRGLLDLLAEAIDRWLNDLHQEGIKITHLGDLHGLADELQAKIRGAIDLTKNNHRMALNVAFNYGGRADILHAVRRVVEEGIPAVEIDEDLFKQHLYTNGLPDPDLVIRTAGEVRLSNFLLWQAAYSEYYFTRTLWPDFGEAEIRKALVAYSKRERRFGGLQPNGGTGS